MAGPAIRAFEIATELATIATVRLLSTQRSELSSPDFEILCGSKQSLRQQVDWADIIIFQGVLLTTHPWIVKTKKVLVADIYDPMHLENLEQQRGLSDEERLRRSLDILSAMNRQIRRADYLICASDKQRDFWLGQMAALGRLNPATYDRDSSLRSLIDVVPFGIQSAAPVQTQSLIKGRIPGIDTHDKVIIWGGGIYNWFDPLTLIAAIKQLSRSRPNVRLVFMGTKHPNPDVPAMKMATSATLLARELELLDSFVFFMEGWVPYEERANALLDADLGVSTHFEHLETAFSFRTRILDYLWAGLPIVATRGDTFGSIIESNGLGITVNPESVEELAAALEDILFNEQKAQDIRARVREFATTLSWSQVLKPLSAFVLNASEAPDRAAQFPRLLRLVDRDNGRRVLQRLQLYWLSARRIGLTPTLKSIANSIRLRVQRSGRVS